MIVVVVVVVIVEVEPPACADGSIVLRWHALAKHDTPDQSGCFLFFVFCFSGMQAWPVVCARRDQNPNTPRPNRGNTRPKQVLETRSAEQVNGEESEKSEWVGECVCRQTPKRTPSFERVPRIEQGKHATQASVRNPFSRTSQ
jgi:hypothetical protein